MVCRRRTTEAQSEAKTFSKKWLRRFFDTQETPAGFYLREFFGSRIPAQAEYAMGTLPLFARRDFLHPAHDRIAGGGTAPPDTIRKG